MIQDNYKRTFNVGVTIAEGETMTIMVGSTK